MRVDILIPFVALMWVSVEGINDQTRNFSLLLSNSVVDNIQGCGKDTTTRDRDTILFFKKNL